jgi:hypothetical protein
MAIQRITRIVSDSSNTMLTGKSIPNTVNVSNSRRRLATVTPNTTFTPITAVALLFSGIGRCHSVNYIYII